ncbi:hypothetical protein B0G80_2040 [Paraburkholderia sp. BL6669N2]|nr:hypothetical protein B0G80_2040 [Paraburkholderia sp. BL6669N2]
MALALVCLGLSGCVIQNEHVNGAIESTRYFGVVKIDTYGDRELQVTQNKFTTVGLRVGAQSGVGFFSESILYVPLDCRVVVLVNTESQLEAARRFIQDPIMATELCVQKSE